MSQSEERDGEWLRPLPRPDNVTAPYWEAAARRELLIQRCPACGHRQFYPRALCTVCAADPEWERASGQGTVHTFTVIRQNYAKPFRDELPYARRRPYRHGRRCLLRDGRRRHRRPLLPAGVIGAQRGTDPSRGEMKTISASARSSSPSWHLPQTKILRPSTRSTPAS